ncbi:hypothetical protein ACRARG_12180 [Pseudooceanicola sp. C21-150M6]|uniref:hypothetical protein n=1 Tax=Pseudooceanicola sp. C21-150M6 TaxID=3434355 RepID=UPI003D7FB6CD
MCDTPKQFSFRRRAVEKAAARARVEARLADGSVTPAELSHENGMLIRAKVTYKCPSDRMQRLAKKPADD